MKFKYLGDREEMNAFGYDFSNGNTPEVTDAKAIAKLQGNSHFEEVEEDPKTKGSSATEEVSEPAEGEPAAVRKGRKKLTV